MRVRKIDGHVDFFLDTRLFGIAYNFDKREILKKIKSYIERDIDYVEISSTIENLLVDNANEQYASINNLFGEFEKYINLSGYKLLEEASIEICETSDLEFKSVKDYNPEFSQIATISSQRYSELCTTKKSRKLSDVELYEYDKYNYLQIVNNVEGEKGEYYEQYKKYRNKFYNLYKEKNNLITGGEVSILNYGKSIHVKYTVIKEILDILNLTNCYDCNIIKRKFLSEKVEELNKNNPRWSELFRLRYEKDMEGKKPEIKNVLTKINKILDNWNGSKIVMDGKRRKCGEETINDFILQNEYSSIIKVKPARKNNSYIENVEIAKQ
jgi:hypothetical protein